MEGGIEVSISAVFAPSTTNDSFLYNRKLFILVMHVVILENRVGKRFAFNYLLVSDIFSALREIREYSWTGGPL